jgi:hypothetical protein
MTRQAAPTGKSATSARPPPIQISVILVPVRTSRCNPCGAMQTEDARSATSLKLRLRRSLILAITSQAPFRPR